MSDAQTEFAKKANILNTVFDANESFTNSKFTKFRAITRANSNF